jgi:hypothetical protein
MRMTTRLFGTRNEGCVPGSLGAARDMIVFGKLRLGCDTNNLSSLLVQIYLLGQQPGQGYRVRAKPMERHGFPAPFSVFRDYVRTQGAPLAIEKTSSPKGKVPPCGGTSELRQDLAEKAVEPGWEEYPFVFDPSCRFGGIAGNDLEDL